MKRTQILAAAVLAATSLGLVAVTQAQPFAGPGYGPGPGMMRGMGPAGGAWGDPAAASQSRLAALKTQLNITGAQEAAWQAYADAVTAQAQQMKQFHDQAAATATTNAAERSALHAGFMQKAAQGAATVSQALQPLYAALSPEQRAILDQRPAWHGGMRGPFGG